MKIKRTTNRRPVGHAGRGGRYSVPQHASLAVVDAYPGGVRRRTDHQSERHRREAFIVRWTAPEGVAPQDQVVRYWTDDGYRWLTQHFASRVR